MPQPIGFPKPGHSQLPRRGLKGRQTGRRHRLPAQLAVAVARKLRQQIA